MTPREHGPHESSRLGRGHTTGVDVPFQGDVQDWLRRLEVYTPFDDERLRDLERWRQASARDHADACVSLLSVGDALRITRGEKPPLTVCFPLAPSRRARQRYSV